MDGHWFVDRTVLVAFASINTRVESIGVGECWSQFVDADLVPSARLAPALRLWVISSLRNTCSVVIGAIVLCIGAISMGHLIDRHRCVYACSKRAEFPIGTRALRLKTLYKAGFNTVQKLWVIVEAVLAPIPELKRRRKHILRLPNCSYSRA